MGTSWPIRSQIYSRHRFVAACFVNPGENQEKGNPAIVDGFAAANYDREEQAMLTGAVLDRIDPLVNLPNTFDSERESSRSQTRRE